MIKTKKIALVGAGARCKIMLKDYSDSNSYIHIVAIMDNCRSKWGEKLSSIPIIALQNLREYGVEEYWITSIQYASELIQDLDNKYDVNKDNIHILEDINIFLYYRIKEKYKDYIDVKKKTPDLDMNKIINYMKKRLPRMFCYDFVDDYLQRRVDVIKDSSRQMLYIIHNNRKLFFPKKYSEKEVRELYNYLCMEQDKDSPHKYLEINFQIHQGDIIADIGASEGMFTLDHIEKVKYAYLFEADGNWVEALKETFAPYTEKVQIVEKYVSNISSEKKISLDDFFDDKQLDFIKMDIEGEELLAMYGSEKILKRGKLRASICTYHNKGDYEKIAEYSTRLGYKYTGSTGFLLCTAPWERGNPDLDFRRGIIRLEKI